MLHPTDWFRKIVSIELDTVEAVVAIKFLGFVLLIEKWEEVDFEN